MSSAYRITWDERGEGGHSGEASGNSVMLSQVVRSSPLNKKEAPAKGYENDPLSHEVDHN